MHGEQSNCPAQLTELLAQLTKLALRDLPQFVERGKLAPAATQGPTAAASAAGGLEPEPEPELGLRVAATVPAAVPTVGAVASSSPTQPAMRPNRVGASHQAPRAPTKPPADQMAAARFARFDLDLDGVLDMKEVSALVQAMGFVLDPQWVIDLIARYDVDQDGAISLAEFHAMYAFLESHVVPM